MGLTLAALGASLRLSKSLQAILYSRHPWRSPRAIGFAGVRDGILPSQSNPLRGIAPARRIKYESRPKAASAFWWRWRERSAHPWASPSLRSGPACGCPKSLQAILSNHYAASLRPPRQKYESRPKAASVF